LLVELEMFQEAAKLVGKYPKISNYLKRNPNCPDNIKKNLK
jgi:hypothetical protein